MFVLKLVNLCRVILIMSRKIFTELVIVYTPAVILPILNWLSSYLKLIAHYAVEVLPLRASDVRSLDNCINVVVARVFKLSSNVSVQVVRSMLDLNDILSLVAKRGSQFLCNLDCVPFFQNYSVLHFSLCSLFFLTFISRAMSFFCMLCLFIFVLVVLQLFCE